MKKVILISGKAGHGKTTVAEIMKEKLESRGERAIITRFAYYLKDIATRYFNWDGIKDEKGRTLLQTLGTDIIRNNLNMPNFHVNRICEDIEIGQDGVDYVIIDDARFPNEIYYPKAMFNDKVVSVRVVRVTEDGIYESNLDDEQKRHPSETSLDNFKFDYMLINNSMDELTRNIDNFLEKE